MERSKTLKKLSNPLFERLKLSMFGLFQQFEKYLKTMQIISDSDGSGIPKIGKCGISWKMDLRQGEQDFYSIFAEKLSDFSSLSWKLNNPLVP